MKTIRASDFLRIPATDLPGAHAMFGDEDDGPATAWREIREMAATGRRSMYDLYVTSTQWQGLRRAVP